MGDIGDKQACELWNAARGAKKTYTKWVTGPEPVKFSSKPYRVITLISEMKRILCWSAYDLSIKTSPVTPISNKVVGFSDFPLILMVHRETRCLFEISTEFAGAKIKTKIKKRDSPCKRLDAKITFFLHWSLGGFRS